ncbi:type II toxin-antitoxin system RelE family toxin [Chrysiogenes arsenatis]|uniref:type II toxin-antitoxin system RelE family toxin n=1 Tax=Chrysiogenes arsenatis TaxID=309797 RepID=UPI0003FB6A01|nr:type II toxin-antitoxin system RelE/ParE family toxin [Chrysiogenes arsenatis]
MKIKYSEQALSDLKSFNQTDRQLIVNKIHYLRDNFTALAQSKKVTELKGTRFAGQYRFIVARKIRVLFRVQNNVMILLVLRVGLRKNAYEQ